MVLIKRGSDLLSWGGREGRGGGHSLYESRKEIGSLSNYDDDDDNFKKTIGLMIKTTALMCIMLFSRFLWRPLHHYQVKAHNLTFNGGRGDTTTNFPSSQLNLNKFLTNSTPWKISCIWHIERVQLDAIKFERTQIHFFRHVFTAVVGKLIFAIVFLGICSIWWREEEGKISRWNCLSYTRHVTYLNLIGHTNASIESVPGTSQPQRNITCAPRLDINTGLLIFNSLKRKKLILTFLLTVTEKN